MGLVPRGWLLVGVRDAAPRIALRASERWRNAGLLGSSASRVTGGEGRGLRGVIPYPLDPYLWDR